MAVEGKYNKSMWMIADIQSGSLVRANTDRRPDTVEAEHSSFDQEIHMRDPDCSHVRP